jgi:bacterioferritin-associated ferredoxin
VVIVCICWGVPEDRIRQAVSRGARTSDEVGDACLAGTACGSCRLMIAEIIESVPVVATEAPDRALSPTL